MVFNIQTTYHIAQKATVFLVWLIATTVKNQPCINLFFSISLFSPPLKCDFTSSREIDLPGWELLLQIFTFEFQRSFLHSSSCSDAVFQITALLDISCEDKIVRRCRQTPSKQGCGSGYFSNASASTPIASASTNKKRKNDR